MRAELAEGGQLGLRKDIMEDSTSDVKSFTAQQVAERLGVSAATVQDLLRSGELIGYKLKRQWRVLDSDLRAFLDARRRRS